jgi:hypothetical protein
MSVDWVMQDDNDDLLCVEQQTNIFCCGKLPLSWFISEAKNMACERWKRVQGFAYIEIVL